MNKNNFIKKFSKQSSIKKKKSEHIFNFMIGIISKDLGLRNEVLIEGFGDFKIVREEMKVHYHGNIKKITPPKDIINFIPSTIFDLKKI